jgi:ubiquinone/menaquinone biosynthesis C-methylase UbiE
MNDSSIKHELGARRGGLGERENLLHRRGHDGALGRLRRVVGTTLQIVGETLCEEVDLRSNERVIDVAAGNGNATLAAEHRFAEVVSTDYVGALLERGRERAKADRLPVIFLKADAENLPFETGSFDVVLSSFGVMFAPDQEKAASELVRVCRRGGRIGLAHWTTESFVGRLFKIIGEYVPPAPSVRSPALWGTKAYLRSLVGARASVAAESRFLPLQVARTLDRDLPQLLRPGVQSLVGTIPKCER